MYTTSYRLGIGAEDARKYVFLNRNEGKQNFKKSESSYQTKNIPQVERVRDPHQDIKGFLEKSESLADLQK